MEAVICGQTLYYTPRQALYMLPQSLWVHMSFVHVYFRSYVWVSSIPSASYTLSASPSTRILALWEKEFDGDIPFRPDSSKVSNFVESLAVVLYFCSHSLQESSSKHTHTHTLTYSLFSLKNKGHICVCEPGICLMLLYFSFHIFLKKMSWTFQGYCMRGKVKRPPSWLSAQLVFISSCL